MKKMDRFEALWKIALVYAASCWAYFQPVHHMIYVLLFILLANFIARIMGSINGYRERKGRGHRFSFRRWLTEVRLVDILKEFMISAFLVMVMCVIYKTLKDYDQDASAILTFTRYGVYVALVGYIMMLFGTIEHEFPNAHIVRVFKAVFDKVNVFKMFGATKDVSDEVMDEIKNISRKGAGDEKKKNK